MMNNFSTWMKWRDRNELNGYAARRKAAFSALRLSLSRHKSYVVCIFSHVCAVEPKTNSSRRAISGVTEPFPLRILYNVFRETPSCPAASATDMPLGSKQRALITSPGCAGLCIVAMKLPLNDNLHNLQFVRCHLQNGTLPASLLEPSRPYIVPCPFQSS